MRRTETSSELIRNCPKIERAQEELARNCLNATLDNDNIIGTAFVTVSDIPNERG